MAFSINESSVSMKDTMKAASVVRLPKEQVLAFLAIL